jgi:capsular exopolysaccharide synthesis family protein
MEEAVPKKSTFEIKNYLLKLIAYWYLFAISMVIGFVYYTIDNRFAESNYSTNSTIILNDDLQNTQAVVGALKLFDTRKNYENEFGVLKSYALNLETVKKLNFTISYFKDEFFRTDVELYIKSPFIVKLDTTKAQKNYLKCYLKFISADEFTIGFDNSLVKHKLKFGKPFQSDNLNFTIEKNEALNLDYSTLVGNEYYFFKNDLNALAKYYQNKLGVDLRSPNSSILWLWIDGPVPERIVDYINKLIEIYLKKSLDDKNRVVINTIDFIDSQLLGIIDSLGSTENLLQVYKQNNKILDLDKESSRLFSELEKYYDEKKLLSLKQSFYEYQLKDLNQNNELTNRISPAFLGINDPILESFIMQYQQLQSDEAVVGYDVKKDFPNLDIIRLKKKNITNDIKNHIVSTVKAIEFNKKELNNKIAQTDFELQKVPSIERELQNIQRRFNLNDNIYTFLLQKRTEAGITMSTNSPGAKILDVARYENVVKNAPMPGANRTKTILICLILPVLIIASGEFFKNKIIDKADVEKGSTIPILGSVSKNTFKDMIPVKTKPKSPVSESFRLIKANMKYLLVDIQNPVISINSTVSGEGKSFCSVNIAALMANSNKKTLLIDVDLRKPKAHLAFDHPNIIGLSSVLIGDSTVDEVLFSTHIKNLYFIPAGKIPVNPAELIESERMELLMNQLKTQFDVIVLDTPPVAHVADAILLSKYTNLNVFVIRQKYSSKNVLPVIQELIDNKRMKKMGAIINDVNPSVIFGLKYGYGFGYGYSYGYGYGDGQGYYEIPEKKPSLFSKLGHKFYHFLKNIFS